jgi:gas vesicle protein
MGRRSEGREVVYVERASDSSAKWLFWGALLGAGVALLYAPRSGEETRRGLQRRLWKLRAMTEEKFDEFAQQLGGGKDAIDDLMDDDELDDSGELPPVRPRAASVATAREELERRLAESRARRRSVSENEEPPA